MIQHVCMDVFTCKRCGFVAKKKYVLLCHLQRKKTCEPTNEDLDVHDLIVELTQRHLPDKVHECDKCGKQFSTRSGKSHHMKICTSSKSNINGNVVQSLHDKIVNMEQEIIKLKEVSLLSNTNHGTITNNSGTINNNNNVTINVQAPLRNFGRENMDAIPESYLAGVIMDLNIRDLIDNLHFDPDFPENHNVRLLSNKQRLMQMYMDDKWQTIPMLKGITELIDQATTKFFDYYEKNEANVIEDVGEEDARDLLNKLKNLEAMVNDKFYRGVSKDVQALLIDRKNDTALIEKS